MEFNIDKYDRTILNRIQSDFPASKRPFMEIAKELGLEEEFVIRRIASLKKAGIIRRIGGNFTPEKLGFVSTLCAAKVPDHKIPQFTELVNSYKGVTHNYQRESDFNIWFTFIERSMFEIERALENISKSTGINIINLPATKVFKIKAHFNL